MKSAFGGCLAAEPLDHSGRLHRNGIILSLTTNIQFGSTAERLIQEYLLLFRIFKMESYNDMYSEISSMVFASRITDYYLTVPMVC